MRVLHCFPGCAFSSLTGRCFARAFFFALALLCSPWSPRPSSVLGLPQHRRPPHTSLPTASLSAPSRARQDGEFDDTLAWKLLHHLHRKRGSLDAFKQLRAEQAAQTSIPAP